MPTLTQKVEIIQKYRERLQALNKELTKKELFKDLLHRLYAGSETVERVIDEMTGGAETTILNIPRKDKIRRGSADTLYNKIIIEFENDLKPNLKHAKEQLAGYLLGQFNSGEGYNFTLIASDFITWKVFAPDISQLNLLETLQEHELILNEVESASFTLDETNAEDFYFWIDQFLFKEEKQKATLRRMVEAFGQKSHVFIDCFRELSKQYNEIKKYGEIQVSVEQWRKFLSIAYGSFDASDDNFLIHTYLSVFAKLIAYSSISSKEFIEEAELAEIMSGKIFEKNNIDRFIENDFFHWVGNPQNFPMLTKVFRVIAQKIATYDFNDIDEDILKGVYQELIDLDTRHVLGEYYTPDWLCERIVNEYNFKKTDKILDPSCGSGSFLVAAIRRLKELHPEMTFEEISANIYGIDIHPLSVQIAKTNILILFGKEIRKKQKPIYINVILANSLLAPEGVENLFGGEFSLQIDKTQVILSTQILDDNFLFNAAIDICDSIANQTLHKSPIKKEALVNIIKNQTENHGFNGNISESFYKLYLAFKEVKEKKRDSIWSFIIKNIYMPYFFSKRFNYIIGNPPWFTYSSIKNEQYQNQLSVIAENYFVKPSAVRNFPHLEIAAIFMSYCSSYFLKDNGKLAFVLPRSFFSADQHDNTRSGKAKGFALTQIWDLNEVSPLFNVPSCVLFAEKSEVKKELPKEGLKGLSLAGRLPSHNCNWEIAQTKLKENPQTYFYIKQGKATAFSTRQQKIEHKINPYRKLFKQGATIVPRAFYFVQLNQASIDWEAKHTHLKTSKDIAKEAKAPWKGIKFSGRVETKFVFRTALAKSILPFSVHQPDLVVLPITIDVDEKQQKSIAIHTPDEFLDLGQMYVSIWFQDRDNIWNVLKTNKSKNMSGNDRLNFHRGLTQQNLNAPYLVIYTASAKDANAAVVKREDFDREFIVDSISYVYYTDSLKEANYLTAILNSTAPNLMMKDFQAKGLFGARHVHKKILDVYFPKFSEKNEKHSRLAELGRIAHEKTAEFLKNIDKDIKIEGLQLGKLRVEIKKNLSQEMQEIDEIVQEIIK
ncbi:N-6 DNA methylase [Thermoflexibacter ruber]|uniref:site-specific DNA-methyltransferase (adenine-specific) n=1 Tax=Thermoflexibacter ruber TaxID=1003 RepID=A0A1I2IVK4_9BACT|nr:N-6 DNA methylase [Thermoflexibacter ruber]SFF44756.1 N-6 DNA Methylase [Thermoflexibacter ruber]